MSGKQPQSNSKSGEAADVRGLARAELEASGLSQAAAARQIGISDAALSQWLGGKYAGDGPAVAGKVAVWLRSRRDRAGLADRLPEPPEWVETPTARRILAGLGYAQLAGDVAVVHGGAGLGKTCAAKRYASRQPSVWTATMTAGTRALGPCLGAVAAACGLGRSRRPLAQLEEGIRDRLARTGGLLVVDEAQHLTVRALDSLRGIHDATGTGLALLGGRPLYSRMLGGRSSEDLAQLHSRVGRLVSLGRPAVADVDALLGAWNVDARRLCAAATEIASGPGALRALTKALRYAHLLADGKPVLVRHLRAAWKEMGG